MATMQLSSIRPAELAQIRQAGQPVELIDVRTPAEFREVHIDFARNVPLEHLDAKSLAEQLRETAGPIYVVCRSGARGRQACEKLIAAGLSEVVNVEGGTLAWEAQGLPVVRGQKTIALERQVRIAAGSLILIGALLALFVHPYLIGLSAFVGAGLIFSGVTDTCGMGLVLARMPWNQVAEAPGCCAAASK